MSSFTYIENPNLNLVCCICRAPFLDPYTTRTCCHTFCYECIVRAIAVSRQCPIDRCQLSVRDLAPADPVIRNLVDELTVECPQRSRGCVYTCQRVLLSSHLENSCEFVEVPCPDGICDKRILRKYISQHTHTELTVPDLTNAKSKEPSSTTSAATTSSNITSSLTDQAPASGALAAENAFLRLRLAALEGVVSVMRQELQAVQHALGPWYRPEMSDGRRPSEADTEGNVFSATVHELDATMPTAQVQVLPQVNGTARPRSRNQSSVASPSQIPASNAAAGDTSDIDLASYFPPASEDDIYSPQFLQLESQRHQQDQQDRLNRPTDGQTPSTTQRPHSTPMQIQATAYPNSSHAIPSSYPPTYLPPFSSASYSSGPSNFPPMSYASPTHSFSPTAITVPPLDLTTPLPNTFGSLHASLVSLAGALSALVNARAADSLHMGEELRSVRAGMHGLRMQLHDIMTTHLTSRGSSSTPANNTGIGVGATEAIGVDGTGIGFGGGGLAWLAYGSRGFGNPTHLPATSTKL
ncbi:hypothetical protein AcW1_009244 [Taiwanofungus camphoratus]|nr:hypothetical protein AcW1_009244 [Antrodia cinnamomea]